MDKMGLRSNTSEKGRYMYGLFKEVCLIQVGFPSLPKVVPHHRQTPPIGKIYS